MSARNEQDVPTRTIVRIHIARDEPMSTALEDGFLVVARQILFAKRARTFSRYTLHEVPLRLRTDM
jgi:hypothetical protein